MVPWHPLFNGTPEGKRFIDTTIVCVVYHRRWIIYNVLRDHVQDIARTFKKADDIMNTGGTLTPSQIAKLTSIMEQLTQKRDTLKQLNT